MTRQTSVLHKTALTFEEAVICWQLHWLGNNQHQIAAVFKVNQRCVHEVLREKKHIGSQTTARRTRQLSA
jgi:hypothetical protein